MSGSSQPTAPGLADYALLCALAALWGGSFMLIKFALVDYPPLTMTLLRLAVGAAILYVAAGMRRERLNATRGELAIIAAIGFFGNALPFTLISWGEKVVDAGLTAILMGIMPIATLILAHFFSAETLTRRKLAGVLVGFAGLVILTGPTVLRNLGGEGIAQIAIFAAAISYGIGAILTKKVVHLPRRPAGAAIIAAGMVMTLPVALAIDGLPGVFHGAFPGLASTLAVVILGLLPTAAAALIMFAVLDRQGAGYFSQVNLLVPPFGVLWAAIVLGERPGPAALVAMAFILAGILIARGRAPVQVRADAQTINPIGVQKT